MIFRRIERREIVEVVLDLGTIRDFEAKRAEQGFDTIERARDRMERADTKTASGKRDIQRIGGSGLETTGVGVPPEVFPPDDEPPPPDVPG